MLKISCNEVSKYLFGIYHFPLSLEKYYVILEIYEILHPLEIVLGFSNIWNEASLFRFVLYNNKGNSNWRRSAKKRFPCRREYIKTKDPIPIERDEFWYEFHRSEFIIWWKMICNYSEIKSRNGTIKWFC